MNTLYVVKHTFMLHRDYASMLVRSESFQLHEPTRNHAVKTARDMIHRVRESFNTVGMEETVRLEVITEGDNG